MSPRAGLYVVAKRGDLPCRESKFGLSACGLVTTLTDSYPGCLFLRAVHLHQNVTQLVFMRTKLRFLHVTYVCFRDLHSQIKNKLVPVCGAPNGRILRPSYSVYGSVLSSKKFNS